jgi:HlyD family secretion protein
MATPVLSRSILPPIATEQVVASRVAWRWVRRGLILGLFAGGAVVLRFTYFQPAIVPVTVVRVQAGRVEELVTNNKAGTITARRQASLGPEIGGRIVRLPAEEGRHVRQGDVLLVLADADLRAQLTLQERSLEAAHASATEACANADLAARELDRARRLVADGFASQQSVDQVANQRVAAVASCSAATARVGQAGASVDVARLTLAKATLLAPFDAVVSKVSAHLGEWITPSPAGLPMPTALELVDVRSIYVKAPLDEVDAGRARAGLPARITMDAFPGRTFPAHVTRVGAYVSEAQQQNRTFDIELRFDDGAFARTVLPGTSADVEVILRARDGVPRLPTSAILQGGRVLVVRQDVLATST